MQQVAMRTLADRFMKGVQPPAEGSPSEAEYFSVLKENIAKLAQQDPAMQDLHLGLHLVAGICPARAEPFFGWS